MKKSSKSRPFFDVLNNKFDRDVKFFLKRGYTHILTSKNGRNFEDLFPACPLSSLVTFLTSDHVYKSDLTRFDLRVLTIINCIELATFHWPGAGGMPGYDSLSDSLGSSCVFLKWRPSGFVKIGKIEGILTSEQTPLWYR